VVFERLTIVVIIFLILTIARQTKHRLFTIEYAAFCVATIMLQTVLPTQGGYANHPLIFRPN
jgi:H+/gluconate symporter-like permease